MATVLDKLGTRVDGWADLVDGAGDTASAARDQLRRIFQSREIPGVTLKDELLTPSSRYKERPFALMSTIQGVTFAAYIGAYGNDLYAKWDVYVKPVLNKAVLLVIVGLPLVLSLLCGAAGSLISLLVGDGLTLDTIGVTFFGVSFFTVLGAIQMVILFAALGLMMHKNAAYFFVRQMDEFEVDDIAALGLAVHHSMLHALDAVGIELQALRLKETFAVGREGRII